MSKKYALLIIDMLNEYVSPKGKIYCKTASDIIPSILRLKNFLKSRDGNIIYVNTSHIGDSDPEIKKWGLHAMRGTWGAKVCDELKPSDTDVEICKRTYDGFYNTELEITLKTLNITDVIVVGIHTHVCVMLTALGAFYRGYNVIALEDCMTTGYQENHDSRLRFYTSHIGKLTTSDNFIKDFDSYDNSDSQDNSI